MLYGSHVTGAAGRRLSEPLPEWPTHPVETLAGGLAIGIGLALALLVATVPEVTQVAARVLG